MKCLIKKIYNDFVWDTKDMNDIKCKNRFTAFFSVPLNYVLPKSPIALGGVDSKDSYKRKT